MGVVHLARRPGGERVALRCSARTSSGTTKPAPAGPRGQSLTRVRSRGSPRSSTPTPMPTPVRRHPLRARPLPARPRASGGPHRRGQPDLVRRRLPRPRRGARRRRPAPRRQAVERADGGAHPDPHRLRPGPRRRRPQAHPHRLAARHPRLPRAGDPVRRRRHRSLRRALLGGHGRVRRHRPSAVRPRPVDGDHGPGPPRRARPHRPARRSCATWSRRRSTPTPRGARRWRSWWRGCTRRPPGSSGRCPRSRPRRCCRGPLHGAALAGGAGARRSLRAARRRAAAPAGPDRRPPTTSSRGTTRTRTNPPSGAGTSPRPSPGCPWARGSAGCCSSSPAPARGRRADGAAVAVAAAGRRRTWSLRSGSLAGSAAGTDAGCGAGGGTTACSSWSPRPGTSCAGCRAHCCWRCGAPGSPRRPPSSATRWPPGLPPRSSRAGSSFRGVPARPGQLAGPRAAGPRGRPGVDGCAALAGRGAARPGGGHGHRLRRGIH